MLLAVSMEEEDGSIFWILFPGSVCLIGESGNHGTVRTPDMLCAQRRDMRTLVGRGKMELWRDGHMHEERSFPKESARPKADA